MSLMINHVLIYRAHHLANVVLRLKVCFHKSCADVVNYSFVYKITYFDESSNIVKQASVDLTYFTITDLELSKAYCRT